MPSVPRLEVTIWFLHEGISQAVILHYIPDPVPSEQETIDAMGSDYANLVAPIAKALITTETSYNGLTLRLVNTTDGFVTENFEVLGAGTVTGDTCPGEVSAIIRKIGSGPPKRAHGTMFWPCVPESFTEDSRLTPTARTTYFTGLNSLVTPADIGGSALQLCVYSRTANNLFPTSVIQVMTILGHQRRRRPRR